MADSRSIDDSPDDVMGWLVMAVAFSAVTLVPSVLVFIVTYLRAIGLHAELLMQDPVDPKLLDAAQANDAICFVSAIVASISALVGVPAGVVALFRWQKRTEGPHYPTGG